MEKAIKLKIGTQYGRVLVTPDSFDAEAGTFDIVFATETPVFRVGWDENFYEVLNCSANNVRSDRMNVGLNLLNAHPDYTGRVMPEDVMGKISDCRFVNNTLVGTVTLGAQCTPATRSDIQNGILNTFSVGYSIYAGVREEDLTTNTVIYRMTDWEPNHVAIAPIPADINSNSRARENENKHNFTLENYSPKKETKMTVEEIRAKASDEEKLRLNAIAEICRAAKLDDTKIVEFYNSDQTVDQIRSANPAPKKEEILSVDQIRSQVSDDEKKRFDAILKSTRAAKLSDTRAIELYQSGKSIEEVRQIVIEEFAKGDPKVVNARVEAEAIDKKVRGAEIALMVRCNPKFKDEKNEASEYRGLTLMEIGKELLVERGINVRGKSKDEVARIIIRGDRTLSTGDFPYLLENVANKMLRGQYGFAPEYWDQIARQTSVPDFKQKSLYQLGSSNNFKELPEGDEIKYGKLVEAKQTIRVKSFGQGLLFTRQMLINDDLSAFESIPQKFVLDWNLQRGDLVWGMITGNVTMGDGKTLFHADHKNLATTAGIVGDTTLTAALVAFKNQVDIDGKRKIRIQPKNLIVSPDYEITARKMLTIISPTNTGDVNVWSAMGLTLIVEPRLSGAAWYLSADPNAIDGLYYANLDGQDGLRSNREDDFDTDSVKFAVRGEFGVAAIDYRGWYKNAGQ